MLKFFASKKKHTHEFGPPSPSASPPAVRAAFTKNRPVSTSSGGSKTPQSATSEPSSDPSETDEEDPSEEGITETPQSPQADKGLPSSLNGTFKGQLARKGSLVRETPGRLSRNSETGSLRRRDNNNNINESNNRMNGNSAFNQQKKEQDHPQKSPFSEQIPSKGSTSNPLEQEDMGRPLDLNNFTGSVGKEHATNPSLNSNTEQQLSFRELGAETQIIPSWLCSEQDDTFQTKLKTSTQDDLYRCLIWLQSILGAVKAVEPSTGPPSSYLTLLLRREASLAKLIRARIDAV